MNQTFFITLPVIDVAKSSDFFQALGFSLNPQFTGNGAACVVINGAVSIMLLPRERFTEFSPKPLCDPAHAEALFNIGCDSRAQVDDIVARAEKAGGKIHERSVDYGFMYHGSFADIDGHLWGLNCISGTPPQG
ncbi:MAG TPA: VOC family protein [Lacunisphaera sp.]|nr:VOC family protein [Lacunisphaera sp.]